MDRPVSPFPSTSKEFFIPHFKPATIPSPIVSTRFISDHDCILLNPTRQDYSQGDSSTHLEPIVSSPQELEEQELKVQLAGPRRKIYFEPSTVTAGIVTCGGVCPGLNNVIRALVNTLAYRYGVKKTLGFRYGYQGLVKGNTPPITLTPEAVKDIHQFGGTILGTSRGAQDAKLMVDYLQELGVNILFCIGGDGTQRGALTICNEIEVRQLTISVVGIGKTIDNDLLFVDRSFGFETAVQLAQQSIIACHEEARSTKNGIGIVKLMGRDSGAIALHSSLASGDVNVVLVPELKVSIDQIVTYLSERFKTRDHCLIVCAEGAGQEWMPDSGKKDASGNKVFSDVGEFLKKELATRLKALKIEHTIKYIDPSYTIRAGVTNASDGILCTIYAQMAVHAAMSGKTCMMVGLVHGQFVHLPLSKVTQGKKNVDIKGLHWQAFLDATGSPFGQ